MAVTASILPALTSEVHAGQDLGSERLEVTPAHVEWYTAAVEASHPWYTGASPFGGPIAPALLFHNAPYRSPRNWYLPNLYGNLHAKMQWELFRPMPVGSVVLRRGTVLERYLRRDREFVVAEAELCDEAGRLYARTRSTQSFLADPDRTGIVVERGRERQSSRPFAGTTGQQNDAGPTLGELVGARHLVTQEQCVRFSDERLNYHNDVAEAEKLGFKEVVVQGTLSVCFLSDMLTDRYGEGWFMGGRMQVNLVNVLWAGEAVQAKAIVRERSREGALWREHLEVWTEKDDGTRTIAGTASAVTA